MLGRLGSWRHLVVLLSIAACSVLALLGLIGGRRRAVRRQADHRVPCVQRGRQPAMRIREVVDQDFGVASRHGYERIIPDDFGVPTDVEASSPDANADIGTTVSSEQRRSPHPPRRSGQEFTGQHRYVLSYTLPDARTCTSGAARPRHHRRRRGVRDRPIRGHPQRLRARGPDVRRRRVRRLRRLRPAADRRGRLPRRVRAAAPRAMASPIGGTITGYSTPS